MSVIFILIIISIIVAGGFLWAFVWSVKNGQFKDSYTPSVRILFEDEVSTNEDAVSIHNINQQEKNN